MRTNFKAFVVGGDLLLDLEVAQDQTFMGMTSSAKPELVNILMVDYFKKLSQETEEALKQKVVAALKGDIHVS